MTATRVLILEPAGPESAAIISTAAGRGLEVHAVMQPGGPDCGPAVRSALSGCLLTSFADCARALDEITRHARKAGSGTRSWSGCR